MLWRGVSLHQFLGRGGRGGGGRLAYNEKGTQFYQNEGGQTDLKQCKRGTTGSQIKRKINTKCFKTDK